MFEDTDATKLSYSQFGEDLLLATLLQRRRGGLNPGIYVDVGACWPRKFSNTYALYLKGWHGVCIDPRPGFEAGFAQYRPRDICVPVGVGTGGGSLTYFMFENPVFNTFDSVRAQELAESRRPGRALIESRPIPIRTLDDILDEALSPGESVDVLSIDVEGVEMSVLHSLNLGKRRPAIVVIEFKNGDVEVARGSEITEYFKAAEYKFLASTPQNLFFGSK